MLVGSTESEAERCLFLRFQAPLGSLKRGPVAPSRPHDRFRLFVVSIGIPFEAFFVTGPPSLQLFLRSFTASFFLHFRLLAFGARRLNKLRFSGVVDGATLL